MNPTHFAAVRSLQKIEQQEDKAQQLELLRQRYRQGQAEEEHQGSRPRGSYAIPSLGYALVPWREEEGWPLGGPVESE